MKRITTALLIILTVVSFLSIKADASTDKKLKYDVAWTPEAEQAWFAPDIDTKAYIINEHLYLYNTSDYTFDFKKANEKEYLVDEDTGQIMSEIEMLINITHFYFRMAKTSLFLEVNFKNGDKKTIKTIDLTFFFSYLMQEKFTGNEEYFNNPNVWEEISIEKEGLTPFLLDDVEYFQLYLDLNGLEHKKTEELTDSELELIDSYKNSMYLAIKKADDGYWYLNNANKSPKFIPLLSSCLSADSLDFFRIEFYSNGMWHIIQNERISGELSVAYVENNIITINTAKQSNRMIYYGPSDGFDSRIKVLTDEPIEIDAPSKPTLIERASSYKVWVPLVGLIIVGGIAFVVLKKKGESI